MIRNKKLKGVDYKAIVEEYQEINVDDITDYELRLKEIVFNELSETDRRILLLYAELKTQAKVAALLNVTAPCVGQNLKRIRNIIKAKMNEHDS